MQHHRPAGHAVTPAAAILKTLHACQRVTDGVSVVAVHVVAMARKKCFETLKATHIRCAVEPVIVRLLPDHDYRCLELDTDHVNPVTDPLSSR
ncbi:hypothetical protein D3C87_1141990 [compost metagenome]